MRRETIVILGSTGSIGKNTLEIVKKTKKFKVVLIAANKNFLKISEQIKTFNPRVVIVVNTSVYTQIKKKYQKRNIIFLNNFYDIERYIKKIDVTVSAIPGIAGLEPTIKFTKLSKNILLANKEAIICGWELIKKIANKYSTKITPIDSEHFSIGLLTKKISNDEVKKIYITASGGPFLKLPIKKFKVIKPKDAIKHPKWKMGKKISVDSATLMNKVLEVTEALKLFPFKLNKYEIVVHPQSLIHAIIKLKNGTSFFLYHLPDMKIPIGNALLKNFNYSTFLTKTKEKQKNENYNLDFLPVNKKKFPLVKLITKMNAAKSAPIIINAANEILIDLFLKKKISFNSISDYVFKVLKDKNYKKYAIYKPSNLNKINIIDNWSRITVLKIINQKK